MHIKAPQTALLTNHEVLLHLTAEEAEYDGTDGTNRSRPQPSNYTTILRESLSYLKHTSQPLSPLLQTRASRPATLYLGQESLFSRLVAELSQIAPNTKRSRKPRVPINQAEFLQIYNLRPRTIVDLECIIEEAGQRFDEQQLEAILEIIRQVFEMSEGDVPAGSENVVVPERKIRRRG
jgi:hypothetical protein